MISGSDTCVIIKRQENHDTGSRNEDPRGGNNVYELQTYSLQVKFTERMRKG